VRGIPVVLLLRNGRIVDQLAGAQTAEAVLAWCKRKLLVDNIIFVFLLHRNIPSALILAVSRDWLSMPSHSDFEYDTGTITMPLSKPDSQAQSLM
jgi:hypothetical protein